MRPTACESSSTGRIIAGGDAAGPVLSLSTGLSFWGGVDPDTGNIIDIHHPNHGECVAGKMLLMPTSRGSCSGSGVLLQLALRGIAPTAIIFTEEEEILTLGALVSERIFDHPVSVLRAPQTLYDHLSRSAVAEIRGIALKTQISEFRLTRVSADDLKLAETDRALLQGGAGPAAALAMEVICLMAAAAGAERLTDVSRGHIDGCILAHDANLLFAEKMSGLGAQVAVPTTINAISVDRENWHTQGVPVDFGERASRLADAYVQMGARPTFTCAPYLLDDAPVAGENIGWSESNAVLYANSVLGARTPKHPDYLDLFIAMTGRAPATGAYTEDGRRPRKIIEFAVQSADVQDEVFWPLIGWLAGKLSPDHIPLLTGLEEQRPKADDLKALCAAFATTSGAPMLHIAGHTPEAHVPPSSDTDPQAATLADLSDAWRTLNQGPRDIDLVAIGSPHASVIEVRRIVDLFAGRKCASRTQMIITLGRDVLRQAQTEGLVGWLEQAGVTLIPDLCWCSITEPVFPPSAIGLMTNSGKYAHYAHGLSGRHARLGGLADCVEAAVTGQAPEGPPDWLSG